ncbi:MAG TPA: hypothetical protein VFO69_02920 [Allosphingosinicella sp.]|nr:hypothetical protein [Allosphingosinicella sp.]
MKRLSFSCIALALLAACATQSEVYSPVGSVRYSALGADPFWMVSIGDDRIVLTLGDEGGRADGALESFAFPRVLPVVNGAFRTWESADGAAVISVQARPGPCTGSGSRIYEDHVRIRLSGRELTGCGGRMLGEGQS